VVAVMAVGIVFTLWIGLYPDPFIAMARKAIGI
jgi:hypothetical protein